jgi:heterotetrameric sarcosine oxidase gamma subunit
MSLTTTSQLPIKSPLAGETSFEVPGVARLSDLTPKLIVLHLRGPQAETAIARFSANLRGQNLLVTGDARSMEGGILCRLAVDEYWFLVVSPEDWAAAYARLDDAITGQRTTLSDLTHGYGKLELGGPRAAALLPRLCGLDFSEAGFPDGRVAQTSLAKVHATLVRMDGQGETPRYYLLVDRSLSAYVWEVMVAVMQAFNTKN